MNNQRETLDIYNCLKQFLQIKSPDSISLKSCFRGFGFPNGDKRGDDNFANRIEYSYIEGHYKEDYKSLLGNDLSYESFYHWVITEANEDQLSSLFSEFPFKIKHLFYMDKDEDCDEDYEVFDFDEISSHPIAKDKDFLNDYFHEIAQASNQLILLKKPGNEEDSEIYDINGKCISNLIYNKVFNELDDDNLYGGNLIKSIDKDNFILIEQCGNPYYFSTIKYLFQWNGEEIELIKTIEDDFNLDTKESQILANDISKLFIESLAESVN
ncbi:MAG: hypothetical protein ACK49D_08920 [Flavobacteriia bacterium]|jgi:hypothetical protein|nr:hypothetical protein [Cryomorphaceae bacterium]